MRNRVLLFRLKSIKRKVIRVLLPGILMSLLIGTCTYAAPKTWEVPYDSSDSVGADMDLTGSDYEDTKDASIKSLWRFGNYLGQNLSKAIEGSNTSGKVKFHLTLNGIVLGSLSSGSDISFAKFGMERGNPYGVISAYLYTLTRNITYALMFIYTLFLMTKELLHPTPQGKKELKETVTNVIIMFSFMYIMPVAVSYFIAIRDELIVLVFNTVFGTTDLNFYSAAASNLFNASSTGFDFMKLFAGIAMLLAPFFYIFPYITIALSEVALFSIFPIICLMSIRNKRLMSSWVGNFFANLTVPLFDTIFLMLPLIIKNAIGDVSGDSWLAYTCLVLGCMMGAQPARNAIIRLLGGNMGIGAGGMGGMGALAAVANVVQRAALRRTLGGGGSLGSGERVSNVDKEELQQRDAEFKEGYYNLGLPYTVTDPKNPDPHAGETRVTSVLDDSNTEDAKATASADNDETIGTSSSNNTDTLSSGNIDTSSLGNGDSEDVDVDTNVNNSGTIDATPVGSDDSEEPEKFGPGNAAKSGEEDGSVSKPMGNDANEQSDGASDSKDVNTTDAEKLTEKDIASNINTERDKFNDARIANLNAMEQAKAEIDIAEADKRDFNNISKLDSEVSRYTDENRALEHSNKMDNDKIDRIQSKAVNGKLNEQAQASIETIQSEVSNRERKIEENKAHISKAKEAISQAQKDIDSRHKGDETPYSATHTYGDAINASEAAHAKYESARGREKSFADVWARATGTTAKTFDSSEQFATTQAMNARAREHINFKNFDSKANVDMTTPAEKEKYLEERERKLRTQKIVGTVGGVVGGVVGAAATAYGGQASSIAGATIGAYGGSNMARNGVAAVQERHFTDTSKSATPETTGTSTGVTSGTGNNDNGDSKKGSNSDAATKALAGFKMFSSNKKASDDAKKGSKGR